MYGNFGKHGAHDTALFMIPHLFFRESLFPHLEGFGSIVYNCEFELLAKRAMLHRERLCISEHSSAFTMILWIEVELQNWLLAKRALLQPLHRGELLYVSEGGSIEGIYEDQLYHSTYVRYNYV